MPSCYDGSASTTCETSGGSQQDMSNVVFGQEAVQEGEQGLVVMLICVAQSEYGVWMLV